MVNPVSWTFSILPMLLQIFDYFAENGQVWGYGVLGLK